MPEDGAFRTPNEFRVPPISNVLIPWRLLYRWEKPKYRNSPAVAGNVYSQVNELCTMDKFPSALVKHHFSQSRDAVFQGRMRAKQGRECSLPEKWSYDAQGRCCWRYGGRGNSLVVGAKFRQGTDQAVCAADHLDPGFVCGVFARAR